MYYQFQIIIYYILPHWPNEKCSVRAGLRICWPMVFFFVFLLQRRRMEGGEEEEDENIETEENMAGIVFGLSRRKVPRQRHVMAIERKKDPGGKFMYRTHPHTHTQSPQTHI